MERGQNGLWQSDGGSEFIGSWQAKSKSTFIDKVEDSGGDHLHVPKITYLKTQNSCNADVETVHDTIEFGFYDIEVFRDRDDFFDKATTYGLYYILSGKNSNWQDKSPPNILKQTKEDIDPRVLSLPALNLDKLLLCKMNKIPQRGQHVPRMS